MVQSSWYVRLFNWAVQIDLYEPATELMGFVFSQNRKSKEK